MGWFAEEYKRDRRPNIVSKAILKIQDLTKWQARCNRMIDASPDKVFEV